MRLVYYCFKLFAKSFVTISIITLFSLFLIYDFNKKNSLNVSEDNIIQNYNSKYLQECFHLYKKLRYPNKSLIIRPPLKIPPENMYQDFTQNGLMPITKYFYFDDAYTDSDTDKSNLINDVDMKIFIDNLNKVKNNQPLDGYGDNTFNKLMHTFSSELISRSIAVIGTQIPWVEAILYQIGAQPIVTIDYTRKKYNILGLEWIHVNDYLESSMKNIKFENFDNIASYSSIEHSGLGRYGDPLSPYGDLDAVKQIHCMLKPGGLFFLALPTSHDNSSYIEFNAHRVYGTHRLNLLFQGWHLLHKEVSNDNIHTVFILKKIKI